MSTSVRNAVPDLQGSVDPSVAPGVPAPKGVIYRRDNGDLFVKVGSADTGWIQITIATTTPAPGFYGFAEQGDQTLASGGTVNWSTLLAGASSAMLFYRNLTITNNTKLFMDVSSFGQFMVLFVDGTLTIDAGSSLDGSGQDAPPGGNPGLGGPNSGGAGGGSTADGGSGGFFSPGSNGNSDLQFWAVAPKKAGNGGAGGGNPGGIGGSSPTFPIAFGNGGAGQRPLTPAMLDTRLISATSSVGGSMGGGGGGSDNVTTGGGGGGGGGGTLIIRARRVQLANGTLIARGGAGAAGSGGPGNGGGGGGGMGGTVILTTQDVGVLAAVADVTGGAGGAGINAGAPGDPGSNGEIIIVDPTSTSWTHA